MVWEWRMARREKQNYIPKHRVRKHLSLQPLYHSPTCMAIITTQRAGRRARTKGKPKSGVQRAFWPEILHMWMYLFKSFIKMLPSSKKARIIVTILKSVCSRHLRGYVSLLAKFGFSKILSYLEGKFQIWSSYNSFLFWSSLWHTKIDSILFKWQNGGMWLEWSTGLWPGSYGAGRGQASFSIPLCCSLPCVHDTHQVTQIHCSFPSKLTL